MNVNTGELMELNSEKLLTELPDNVVAVNGKLTPSQMANNRIDLEDTESTVGRQLQAERKKRGLSYQTRNQKRNMRRKLK